MITCDTLTAEQIREARDRFPEQVTAEQCAVALGLPEGYTRGGLPIYPPLYELQYCRERIAFLLHARGDFVEPVLEQKT